MEDSLFRVRSAALLISVAIPWMACTAPPDYNVAVDCSDFPARVFVFNKGPLARDFEIAIRYKDAREASVFYDAFIDQLSKRGEYRVHIFRVNGVSPGQEKSTKVRLPAIDPSDCNIQSVNFTSKG